MESITKEQFEKGKFYYFICFGLPSSGKSTLFNYIKFLSEKNEFKDLNCFYDSSDEIRSELTKEYKNIHQEVSSQKAFEKVGKATAIEFDKRINEFKKKANDDKINIILVDKNFPSGIEKFLSKFCQDKEKNIVIVFVPKIKSKIMIEEEEGKKIIYYPFNLSYIFQCYLRLKQRKEHENLNGDDEQSIYIFLSFLRMFQGFDFAKERKTNVILKELSFTDENNEIDLEIKDKIFFINVMNKIKPFKIELIKDEFKEKIKSYFDVVEAKYAEIGNEIFKDTKHILEEEILDLIKNGY